MSELLSLVPALGAGALLGAIFFGGLWWTVNKGLSSKRVTFWFMGSMLLRTCIVLFGFYFILGDSWQRLLVGLLGFVIVRIIIRWLTRVTEQSNQISQKVDHAS